MTVRRTSGWLAALIALPLAQEPDETGSAAPPQDGGAAPASEPLSAPVGEPGSERPAGAWAQAPHSFEELEARLEAWAAERGGRVRLQSIGRSAGGRRLLAVGTPRASEGASAPTILLAGRSPASLESARDVLAATDAWLARRSEAGGREGLRPQLLALPLLDPDGDGAVRFERNFPAGWEPADRLAGAGPYPLSKPENLAVAELLSRRTDAAALVLLDGAGNGAPREAGAAPLLAEAGFEPLVGGAGSLALFAREFFGLYVWSLAAEGERAAVDGLEALAGALSILRFEFARAERIGDGAWQVEFDLVNSGQLPTSSAEAQARVPAAALRLSVPGADVAALAVRSGEGAFEPVEWTWGQAFVLPPLAPLEARALRLVVLPRSEGAPDGASAIEIEAVAARARGARTRVELP